METINLEQESSLTKEQACVYLGVSTSCLDKWMKAGKLTPIKIGRTVRFTRSILDEFQKKCRSGNTVA